MEDDLELRISEARAFAQEQVDQWGLGGTLNRLGGAGLYCWFYLNLRWVDGPHSAYIDGGINLAGLICQRAFTNAGCRALASEIVATRIRNDQPLTDDLKEFAYLHLMGRMPEIKTKRGKKMDLDRDVFLIMVLNELTARFKLKPTQNDEKGGGGKLGRTKPSPPSGAEILSECFCAIGQHEITPKAIKDVWLHKKKHRYVETIEDLIRNPKKRESMELRFMNAKRNKLAWPKAD